MTTLSSSTVKYNHVWAPPAYAPIEAGFCQFNEQWTNVALLSSEMVSIDTKVLTFATPDATKPLNLATCACILTKGGADVEGAAFIRPYTPISNNAQVGSFTLMVKCYENGNLSKTLGNLQVGESLEFKHIAPNVKKQYPFADYENHIGMVVGGTGITPMIQALNMILSSPTDTRKVSVLYGSINSSNIIAEDLLADWVAKFPDRLSVTHVLSGEPVDSEWKGERGYITKELMEEHFPKAGVKGGIFVCGPPPMYNAICGERTDLAVTGILGGMGYATAEVFKF